MESLMPILASIFIGLGVIFILIGALGLIRLPDVYARIHAAGIIDTAGVAFFILGMICLSGWSLVTVKLILIGIFLFFTSPISGHAIARVAHLSGIKPEGRDLTGQKTPAKKAKKKTLSKTSGAKTSGAKKSVKKKTAKTKRASS